ncbi:hypothetical protein ACMZZG_10900 [Pseudocitrobacter faecalis]
MAMLERHRQPFTQKTNTPPNFQRPALYYDTRYNSSAPALT